MCPIAGCCSPPYSLLQKYHSESKGTDQVAETQAQIDELKGIMVRNIGTSSLPCHACGAPLAPQGDVSGAGFSPEGAAEEGAGAALSSQAARHG